MQLVKNYQNKMDVRLSVPKKVQVTDSKVFKNSDFKLQDDAQRTFYRTGKMSSDSPMARTHQAFDANHTSYTNIKKIRNTIDM